MNIKWCFNQHIALLTIVMLILSQSVLASNKYKIAFYDKNKEQSNISSTTELNEIDTLIVSPGKECKIPVLYGEKSKDEITGSVAFIKGDKIKNIPGVNRMNTLTGRIAGLMVMQNSGLPGEESTSILIRGKRTFGVSSNAPLVLLDGVETDITQISPNDIESISVLKDAVSTAMYGLRGSNGVILISSKKGKSGNIQINFNTQATIIQPSKFPEFLDSAQYAELYNEAIVNDGGEVRYSQSEIDAFNDGTNSLLYPDNNWISDYMANYSIQTRQNLDISGGNENARYFFSTGYVNNGGIFNTDETLNTYNTNSALDLTDIHTNLDLKINDRLDFNVDLKAKFDRRNNPGAYSSTYEQTLIYNMMNTPPLAYPLINEDGSLGGTADYRENIYGELNKTGYSVWTRTFLYGNVNFNYKMDYLLSGLSLSGRFGYSNIVDHVIKRTKSFAVYEYVNDSTFNKIGSDTEMSSTNQWSSNDRYYNGELGLKYKTQFGDNSLNAMLLIDRQEYIRRNNKLPHIYQGIKGQLGYGINSKYIIDLAFAYQGSEQFPDGARYGLFPAIGLGWIVSNEDFMQSETINYLKLRVSGGRTGNDFNPYSDSTPYFAHVENYAEGGAYQFGTSISSDGGFYEAGVENNAITWEKSDRLNIGVDMSILDNRLSLTSDYFYEKNKDILVYGTNPAIFGSDFWYPVGIVKNQGIEGTISWNSKIGDFEYFVSANATFVKNEIVEQKEQQREYEWMVRTGNSIGSRFGYVFDRYFTEDDDISQLPDQSQLGDVQAGDLKYKDMNGDNIIDVNDQKLIGKSNVPELFYGINAGFAYKGFDFNVLFQGIGGSEQIFSGSMVYEFVNGKGNVTERHLGRWTPGAGQNATYPRLSTQNASNNRKVSDYWLEDTDYLRLKSIELGYSFRKSILSKIKLRELRVYASAYNLFTWSKIDFTDPETTSAGNNYPIPRMISAGLNIGF